MGVGFPGDIIEAVAAGVDMFDCVLPTRNGRNAYAFTSAGPIRLRNSRFISERGPIEARCDCYACQNFTRGAIRHSFFAAQLLPPPLVSVHTARSYQLPFGSLRHALPAGRT